MVDGDTDAAETLLFNTLIIRRQMMRRTWIRHEEELGGSSVAKLEQCGGAVSLEEGHSSIIYGKYNS